MKQYTHGTPISLELEDKADCMTLSGRVPCIHIRRMIAGNSLYATIREHSFIVCMDVSIFQGGYKIKCCI